MTFVILLGRRYHRGAFDVLFSNLRKAKSQPVTQLSTLGISKTQSSRRERGLYINSHAVSGRPGRLSVVRPDLDTLSVTRAAE